MKNKLLILTILAILSLPASCQAVDSIDSMTPVNNIQQVQEDVNTTNQQALEEVNSTADNSIQQAPPTENIEQDIFKQPTSKRKMAKKFFIAMLSVAVSSFLIYFFLTIYNKFRDYYTNPVKTTEKEVSLKTPNDLNGAIKTFLEKTRWN